MNRIIVGILLPCLLVGVAVMTGRNELRAFRDHQIAGSDLFVYSRGRLWRRMTGVVLMAMTALTLTAFEFLPAATPGGALVYLAVLVTEVAALFSLPLIDLWETGRTAKPEDLVRQCAAKREEVPVRKRRIKQRCKRRARKN